MKKNIIKTMIFFLLCLSTCVGFSIKSYGKTPAYGYDKSGNWSYHILSNNKTVEIRPSYLDGDKNGVNKGKVNIPSTIKINKTEYKVTKIAKCAFSVCICNKCYSLGQSAAERWKDAVKYGNDNLFNSYHCSVTEINIPNDVVSIEDYAFAGQKKIQKVTFSGNSKLNYIGNYAFARAAIKRIDIPKYVREIAGYSFWKNASLEKINFNGNAIVSIGECAFQGNSLQSVIIPDNCRNIDNYAFSDNAKMKTVTINSTGKINYKKTVFDGAGVKKFYIKDYGTYSYFKSLFKNNTILMEAEVCSEETLVHIKLRDTVKDILVKKNQSIDFRKYCSFNKGEAVDKAVAIPTLTLDKKEGKGIILSSDGVYKATGYPEENITVTGHEISYKLICKNDYDFVDNVERHYTCKLEELPYNQYCYFDKITFAKLPSNFEKTGYTLTGYDIDGVEYNPGETYNGLSNLDVKTLYCDFHYEPNNYTVVYNPNGGTMRRGVEDYYVYDEEGRLSNEVPQNKNMKFLGWSLSADGNNVVYPRKSIIKNLSAENQALVTLYAIWEDSPLNVTLDINGGECKIIEINVNVGEKYESLPVPVKKGYDFIGWQNENGDIVTNDSISLYNYDHKLTAKWIKKKIKVTFNGNGGDITGKNTSDVFYGEKFKSHIKIKRAGYRFLGWYTSPDKGVKINLDKGFVNDTTVYAHWKLIKKDITLNIKPKNIDKQKGYHIKCSINGKNVYNQKKRLSKKQKKVSYKFKGVSYGDKLVIKVRFYRKANKKNVWGKWKSQKYTVKF